MAAKRGRKRKTTRRRVKRKATTRISPMAHLARKVSGIDTRVHGLEAEVKGIPKHFVKRKRKKTRRLGNLEERGYEHWTSGE